MCGIAGILSSQGPTALGTITATLSRLLEHRGPDDHGWLLLGPEGLQRGRERPPDRPAQLMLLHRRLSILDLTEAGWQPMTTPAGQHFIVFNGEIYNYLELRSELEALGHTFHSHSDTEVLLHAYIQWGSQALRRLVGMFAFAILDRPQGKLFLARDFFGIKPLYYTRTAGAFAFASEIKGLLELPGVSRRVNAQRLFEYLRFGKTDHGGQTLLNSVQQLPPAHYLEVSLDKPGTPAPVRYWTVNLHDRLDLSFPEAVGQVRSLFLDNVRLHLRSDVPLGAALSGGIDSSAIVTAMRRVEPRLHIHTFSYLADDPALSEERWVDIAGRRAGAVFHKIQLGPDELVDDLDKLVYQQDEPFGSTSIYAQYRVFRLAREAGITVMLDGQGADELLAGYRPYLAARVASLVRQGHWVEACRFLMRSIRLPGTGGLLRLLLQAAGMLVPPGIKAVAQRLLGDDLLPGWLNAAWFRRQGVTTIPPHRSGISDVLRDQLGQSVMETSLPMLLRFEDRSSMAFSIESRVPFLTPALAGFVLRLPEQYLIDRDGTSKNVFRQAMRGIVPDEVLDRRDKIGFSTPEKAWLSSLQPWVERTLACPAAGAIPALHRGGMQREWQAVLQGHKRFDFRVWRWVNLIRWAERFQVTFED